MGIWRNEYGVYIYIYFLGFVFDYKYRNRIDGFVLILFIIVNNELLLLVFIGEY